MWQNFEFVLSENELKSKHLRDRVGVKMEGEKEHQREEKESNEAEDDRISDEEENEEVEEEEEEEEEGSEGAAMVWQEGYGEDNLGLPIMHWEALSLRIAELEKEEEEKKAKVGGRLQVSVSSPPKHRGQSEGVCLDRGRAPLSWMEERGRRREDSWEDRDDACNSHVLALTSR
nr:cilia- and flagella-associated protein 251-like isoform X1 [Labrus bergylta]